MEMGRCREVGVRAESVIPAWKTSCDVFQYTYLGSSLSQELMLDEYNGFPGGRELRTGNRPRPADRLADVPQLNVFVLSTRFHFWSLSDFCSSTC